MRWNDIIQPEPNSYREGRPIQNLIMLGYSGVSGHMGRKPRRSAKALVPNVSLGLVWSK
jgi:hypothetical protein